MFNFSFCSQINVLSRVNIQHLLLHQEVVLVLHEIVENVKVVGLLLQQVHGGDGAILESLGVCFEIRVIGGLLHLRQCIIIVGFFHIQMVGFNLLTHLVFGILFLKLCLLYRYILHFHVVASPALVVNRNTQV